MSLQTIGNLILLYAAVVAALFVGYYGLRTRWEASPVGRNTFSLSVVILLVLGLLVVANYFRGLFDYQILRVVIFTMTAVVLSWRLVLLIKAQAYGRRANSRYHEEAER